MKNFSRALLSGIIILITVTGIKAEARPVGKILFKSESGKEVMVYSSIEKPSLLLSKGNILSTGKDGKSVRFIISDISGLYIRCSVESTDISILKTVSEGGEVYFSEESNASAKYSDVKKILNSLIRLYENFIYSIESVDDPVALSVSINNFSSDLDRLIPEMIRLNNKYPELKDFNISPPPELISESEILRQLEPRLRDVFYKVNLYSGDKGDENVKKAVLNLQKVLDKMKSGK